MKKENFKNLLTDLYTIYCPANIEYVDTLVERYNHLEADSVKNIYLKYNRKGMAYYDENWGTDEHIIALIKEYNTGARPLLTTNLAEIAKRKQDQKKDEVFAITEQKLQETKQEISKGIEEKISGTENELKSLYEKKSAEIEEYAKKMEEKYSEVIQNMLKTLEESKQQAENDCIIRVFSKNTNSELNLPNKKIISNLGKGSILVVYDENKRITGLEIEDITCDMTSHPDGVPIIEIMVKKV